MKTTKAWKAYAGILAGSRGFARLNLTCSGHPRSRPLNGGLALSGATSVGGTNGVGLSDFSKLVG